MFYVNEPSTFEDSIKKSRFISLSFPCANDQVVLYQLKKLQDEHPHANHIAFAYCIKTNEGISYRFHDAGEPTGTSGQPIFQYIEGKNIREKLAIRD